uniref:Apoptosis regulatory protein Siva n=1 Tax=Glossina brevipalpis TaxID=37001 RepID=A0A1A9W214_9MUSC
MEKISLKRNRSEESLYGLQTKMYINEKIVNLHDNKKMKQIHDRTTKLLFQGARSFNKSGNPTSENSKKPQSWELVILSGNGVIEMAKDVGELVDEFLWVKRKAICCDRETYVQSQCCNCQKALCEGCGYSCNDCGIFLCNLCVEIFGCGTSDRPICEKCSLFT